MITSVINQKIKDVVKLRDSLSRRKNNLFIIEGCREISLALTTNISIKELYICKGFLRTVRKRRLLLFPKLKIVISMK